MTKQKQLATAAVNAPLERLKEIDHVFTAMGLVEWEASSKSGQRTIKGKTADGQTVRLSSYDDNGFSERTISSCGRLSPPERKEEVRRLYNGGRGLTQMQIADRLGVSQKTISNDLG